MPAAPYGLADLVTLEVCLVAEMLFGDLGRPQIRQVLEEVHAITVPHLKKQSVTRY